MITAYSVWLLLALYLVGVTAQGVGRVEVPYGNSFNAGCRDKSCFDDPNVHYHSEYTCSNDTLSWAEGLRSFPDPIPPDNVVTGINVTVRLTFGCANYSTDPKGTVVTIQGAIVRFLPPINASESCDCLNCMKSIDLEGVTIYPQGWPGYNYGGVNALRVVPTQFMCVSVATVFVSYAPKGQPTMTNIFPSLIPVDTTSTITVHGTDFIDSDELYCSFGGELTDANWISSTKIECPAVQMSEPTQTPFQLIDKANGPIIDSSTTFTWYEDPTIEYFEPTSGSSEGVNVTLIGSNFFNSTTMVCRFAGMPVWDVVVVNSTTVICLDVQDFVYTSGRDVPVAFSENSESFVLAPDEFTFLGDVSPSASPSITPSQTSSISTTMTPIPSGTVRPTPSVSPSASFTSSSSASPVSFSPSPTMSASSSLKSGNGTANSVPPKEEDGVPDFIWAAFAVAIIIFIVLLIGIAVLLIQRRRGSSTYDQSFFPDSPGSPGGGPIDPNAIPLKELKDLVQIEKGSFGVIYEATWRGTKIAVKKLPSAMNDKLMKEFYQEAALMRSLRHPNILQYLGVAQSGTDVCICMEFMSNGSLYRLLHRPESSYSRRRIKSICMDTVRGMNYLHQQSPPIVHRDLKSHNLLVDSHWTVKVCDFGLSRITEHNQTMTACGTPSWTAPEVLRNERYTTKADVYGFGVVVWEMFSRADPFPGMPPFQIVFAVGTQKLRPRIEPEWPLEWVNLMTSCWSEDPAARPTFENLITIIEGLDNPV